MIGKNNIDSKFCRISENQFSQLTMRECQKVRLESLEDEWGQIMDHSGIWTLTCSQWMGNHGCFLCSRVNTKIWSRIIIIFLINEFIYLFLAVFGLHCCTQAFSSCGEWGLLFVEVCGLLIVVASLVAEHRLQAHRLQQLWHVGSVVVACGLQSTGSVVVAHGLSCSVACGIFLDQGLNPCPLHWQADS